MTVVLDKIVPGIYGPMLEQIPALAPQTALVLGECVGAPALVKIGDADPVPDSRALLGEHLRSEGGVFGQNR